MNAFTREIGGKKYLFTPNNNGGYDITLVSSNKLVARSKGKRFERKRRITGGWADVSPEEGSSLGDLIVFLIIMGDLEPAYGQAYSDEVANADYDESTVANGNKEIDTKQEIYAGGMAEEHDADSSTDETTRYTEPDPPASSGGGNSEPDSSGSDDSSSSGDD